MLAARRCAGPTGDQHGPFSLHEHSGQLATETACIRNLTLLLLQQQLVLASHACSVTCLEASILFLWVPCICSRGPSTPIVPRWCAHLLLPAQQQQRETHAPPAPGLLTTACSPACLDHVAPLSALHLLAPPSLSSSGPQRSRCSVKHQPHSLGSSSTCRRPLALTRRMRVSVAAAASPAELQQMLAAKERELAAMFESGRPMPQVCVLNRQGRVCVCVDCTAPAAMITASAPCFHRGDPKTTLCWGSGGAARCRVTVWGTPAVA